MVTVSVLWFLFGVFFYGRIFYVSLITYTVVLYQNDDCCFVFHAERLVKGKGHPCKALRLCTDRMAHRGSRVIALPFHAHGTRMG